MNIDEDFPNVRTSVNGRTVFSSGKYCELPAAYYDKTQQEKLTTFYQGVLAEQTGLSYGVDPLGFNYVRRRRRCWIGLLLETCCSEELQCQHPSRCFPKEYILKRIEELHRREHYWDSIPASVVIHNIHEIRGLNAQITAHVEEILYEDSQSHTEIQSPLQKIKIGTRLVKLLLDGTRFYMPDFFERLNIDQQKSFPISKAVTRIVSIYVHGFKSKMRNLKLINTSCQLQRGMRSYFELLLKIFIENAWKYSLDVKKMPPQVYCHDTAYGTDIQIRSYGKLIPETDKQLIFTRGYRCSVHQQQCEGTGMGLYNAYQLAKHYKVDINYESISIKNARDRTVGWNIFRLHCKEAFVEKEIAE